MKKRVQTIALLLCAVFLLALGACSGGAETTDTLQNDQSDDSTAPQSGQALSASDTAVRRPAAEIDLTDAAVITLSGDTASAEGGVQVDGGVITVTSGGVYAVSGRLDEGRIIVNAAGETVTLALNGASVACSYGSPIYIYKSASTTVHLVEGTVKTTWPTGRHTPLPTACLRLPMRNPTPAFTANPTWSLKGPDG